MNWITSHVSPLLFFFFYLFYCCCLLPSAPSIPDTFFTHSYHYLLNPHTTSSRAPTFSQISSAKTLIRPQISPFLRAFMLFPWPNTWVSLPPTAPPRWRPPTTEVSTSPTPSTSSLPRASRCRPSRFSATPPIRTSASSTCRRVSTASTFYL